VLIEREIRHEPLQPAVFFFHLPQAAQFTHAQMRVLLLPGVKGRVTHPELSAKVADWGAAFRLSDRVDNLFLREFRPLHGPTPFVEDRRSCHVTLVLTCRRFPGRRHLPSMLQGKL
jgi:hypothetical protein